ncbi:hypothetical protein BH09PAT2_BH09PAT2_07790 [soil metagenome]
MKFIQGVKRKEFIYGAILFLFSAGYFVLNGYVQKRTPLRVEAATPKTCSPSRTPVGALPGQPAPIWCYDNLTASSSTVITGANAMVDEFNHGLQFADCCGGYKVYNHLSTQGKSIYWRDENQWLVDTDGMSSTMRPDRSFVFVNGKLVVEMDVAASLHGYNKNIWPELDITTASTPANQSVNTQFSGNVTLSCKLLGTDRQIICSLTDKTGKKIYEKSSTTGLKSTAWKACAATESATNCLDRFRFEITKTGIAVFVNNVKYLDGMGLPALPADFINGNVYIYASSWNLNKTGVPYRFYWDRIAVNPEIMPTPTIAKPIATTSAALKRLPTPTQKITITPSKTKQNNLSSIQFKGNGFATLPHASYYNTPKGWSIETWFKDETELFKGDQKYNHPARFLLIKGDLQTTEDIPYMLGIEMNKLFVGTRYKGENKLIYYDLAENNISFNEWHHVASTYDPKTKELILYLDSLPVVKSSLNFYTSSDNIKPLYIGKNGTVGFWIGKVDDLRIWDKAMSAEDIRNSYLNQFTTPPEHLIGNWKFDEGRDDVARDFSLKQENMTVVKGAWSKDVHIGN